MASGLVPNTTKTANDLTLLAVLLIGCGASHLVKDAREPGRQVLHAVLGDITRGVRRCQASLEFHKEPLDFPRDSLNVIVVHRNTKFPLTHHAGNRSIEFGKSQDWSAYRRILVQLRGYDQL